MNLFWFAGGGLPADTDTFDSALRRLMPDGQPVPLDHGLHWLGRLPAGDCHLEDRPASGMELFRLHWQAKQQPAGRRHTVVTRKGNQVVKLAYP